MKKITSVLVVALLFTSLFSGTLITAEESEFTVMIGDVNRDDVLDLFDYLTIKSICLNTVTATPQERDIADVNDDGSLDVFDYAWAKSAVLSDDIDYIPHNFQYNDYELTEGTYVINSFEDYNAFAEVFDKLNSESSSYNKFAKFVGNLAEDYFEENALIVSSIVRPFITYPLLIDSVRNNGSEITVNVLARIGVAVMDEIDPRLIVAEVKKADIDGCTSFTTNLVEIGDENYHEG